MRDFASLFKGREDAHGFYYGLTGKKSERGKRTSKAESLPEPVTPKLYADHLSAKGKRLGIITVCSDGKVWWICLDIDFYDIGDYHGKIAAAIKELKLPLVQCKSKSGGAHLYCFFEDKIMAEWGKKIALLLLDKLNLPAVLGLSEEELKQHVDIFPKNYDPKDINFWVNLPYYGKECHCVGDDGKQDLSLEEFISYANDRITSAELLDRKGRDPQRVKAEKSPYPPCVDWVEKNKIGEGHRDHAMTHLAIIFRKSEGDMWKEKVREYNEQYVEPPMRKDEINKIIRSVESKTYDYMCEQMKTLFCDLKECKKRKFGVGRAMPGDIDIPIEQIEKIDGEQPTYIVTIHGKRIVVKHKEMYNFLLFRQAAFPVLDDFLPMVKGGDWEDIVKEHMANMVTTQIIDVGMRDRVISEFQRWVAQHGVTESFEDAMAAQQAFVSEKQIIFNGDDFMNIIDRKLKCPRDMAFLYMRHWGVIQMEMSRKTYWCYPVNGPLWFDFHKGKKI